MLLKEFLSHANWLAIVVATLAYFVVGAVWYAPPVFGKAWMAMLPKPPSEADRKRMPMLMVLTLLMNFAAVLGIAFLAMVSAAGTALPAIKLGAFVSLLFACTVLCINHLYENKPFKMLIINAGYHIVGMIGASLILCLWH